MNSNLPAAIISTIVTLGMIVLIVFIFSMKTDLPPNLTTLAQVLAGVIAGKFGTVVDYFLGSSASSKAKDDTITNLTNQ